MSRLMEIVSQQKLRKNQDKDIDADLLVDMHHCYMMVYGHISIEEFKKMKIPTFMNLWPRICQELERRGAPTRVVILGMAKQRGAKGQGMKRGKRL